MSLETRKLEQWKDRQDWPSENIWMASTLWHSMWVRFPPDLRKERAKPVPWRETFLQGSRGQLSPYRVDSHPSNPHRVNYLIITLFILRQNASTPASEVLCSAANGTDVGSQRGERAGHLSVTWGWATNQPGLPVQLSAPRTQEATVKAPKVLLLEQKQKCLIIMEFYIKRW